jgi:hypothetical protein
VVRVTAVPSEEMQHPDHSWLERLRGHEFKTDIRKSIGKEVGDTATVRLQERLER